MHGLILLVHAKISFSVISVIKSPPSMNIKAALVAVLAMVACAHATCDIAHQRVLVWGTSTNGLGDVESILAIRDFVRSMCGSPTVMILVTDKDQLNIVKRHLDSSGVDSCVRKRDVLQYAPDKVNLVEHFIPNWGWFGPCDEIMNKKQEAEEKLVHVSADFHKTVCYFNCASVFLGERRMFVTPQNRVENSLTIEEYSGNSKTLWLSPRQGPSGNEYYFAYFYDDYCETLAMFLVSLRKLLQNPGDTVRIVTNVKCKPNYMAKQMAYLFGNYGWSESSEKHWTASNPESEKLLREKGIFIHESHDALTGVEIDGVVFVLEPMGLVSSAEFDSLLFNSGEYAGCTGDSSLSKVLSSKRIPLYQVLSHKEEFVQFLEKTWEDVGGDKHSFYMMMLRPYGEHMPQSLSEHDIGSFKEQYSRFIDRLLTRTTQHELEAYLRSGTPN